MKKGMILAGILFLGISLFAQSGFRLTILYDNYVYTPGTISDWGFSCLIEGENETLLFDTGNRPDLLAQNAKKLNVNLKKIRKVVISHNHGDHFGGLEAVLKQNSGVTVYIPSNLRMRIIRDISAAQGKPVKINKPQKLGPGILTTGMMGSRTPEHSLIVQTQTQNILITGCAHPGIVEIVRKAKKIIRKNIDMVLGGFHLHSCSEKEIREIIKEFRQLGVKKVGATHCTGDAAIAAFKTAYRENFLKMGVGRILEFR